MYDIVHAWTHKIRMFFKRKERKHDRVMNVLILRIVVVVNISNNGKCLFKMTSNDLNVIPQYTTLVINKYKMQQFNICLDDVGKVRLIDDHN